MEIALKNSIRVGCNQSRQVSFWGIDPATNQPGLKRLLQLVLLLILHFARGLISSAEVAGCSLSFFKEGENGG